MKLADLVEVEDLAKQIACEQGMLARSPASINSDGSIVMCAAACIAYAALKIKVGLKVAEDFQRKLICRSENISLEKTFAGVNLPEALCRMIRIENDKQVSSQRLDWFLNSRSLSLSKSK